MDADTLVPIIVSALVGGSVTGGVVALFKLRPETGAIIVSAAQGAVVVQSGVIESLRAENEALREEIRLLRAEVRALRTEVHEDKA